MALSASTVLEVRSTGSDTNGGGFVTGAAGTDYSQQDAAQYSGTDLTVDGTTNTKVTAASHSFASADVGNLIQITAGTGFTVGFYQIVSVASGAATLDRSPGAVSTAGGTWALGGALATPAKAIAAMTIAGMVTWGRGSFTPTGTITTPAGGAFGGPCRFVGYGTTRGDSGRATLTFGTAAAGIAVAQEGWQFENLILDGSAVGTIGINFTGSYGIALHSCLVKNWTSTAVTAPGSSRITGCEITGVTGGTAALSIGGIIVGCDIHGNTVSGVSLYGAAFRCNVYANSGSSSDGIRLTNTNGFVVGCNIYNNGRDGVRNAQYHIGFAPLGNIIARNAGYGINDATIGSAAVRDDRSTNFNAFYSNTSGNRLNSNAGPNDVTLTVDPFVNGTSGNFALNSTAGGGAACRAAGIPGAFPAGTTTGYPDIGAAQHQDSGGGGTTVSGLALCRLVGGL